MRTRGGIGLCVAVLALPVGVWGSASPMADAAMKGDRAALRELVAQRADVNARQGDGATAIQWAAYKDDLEMARMLVKAGSNRGWGRSQLRHILRGVT